jgi:2'-5' RNA ligase
VILPGVYVGIALLDPELRPAQEALCRRWGLVPRAELHLTLLYLGETAPEPLEALATALRGLRDAWTSLALRVTGVGAAAGSEPRLVLREEELLAPETGPRVAWWSVDGGEALQALRARVRTCAEEAGLSAAQAGVTFWPHVTLGSVNPEAPEEPWDQHVLPKEASLLREEPWPLRPSLAHLTSARIHPRSLHPLATW